MSEDNSYQPGWGEKKEHHHHNAYNDGRSSNRTNTWGGWLKLRDKQAYYGLMLIVIAILGFGTYKLVMMFVNEWRAMPHDDPETEMTVDELRIHKVEEEDAISYADSLSQEYNLDSIKRHVQIDTRPVYRPPRKNTEWYLTTREWKSILKNYRIWKRMKQKEKNEREEETDEGMNE